MLGTSTGMQSLYVYDGTGNPAALITSSPTIAFAYDYDPYGVPTLTADSGGLGTSQNPYTLKAGIQDRVTGWVKYGQRWHNPALGRWTQQDTLDAPLDPANANRYAFAANDPINNSDPLGLATGNISGKLCIFLCASIGLSQDDTGAYAITGSFGVGPELAGSATATYSPDNLSTGAGPEVSCQAGPFTGSLGTTGGAVGIATPLGLGCDVSYSATLVLG